MLVVTHTLSAQAAIIRELSGRTLTASAGSYAVANPISAG
jgi:hypothetical protein